MKMLFTCIATVTLAASLSLTSCSSGLGEGDHRDKNLEHALMIRQDSVSDIEYVGMSDVHVLENDRIRTVIIYYVTDSTGNRTERNVRVTANNDCSEIYTWENLDSKVLEDVKQKVSDKFEENNIDMDGSLIDALIKLKRK
ncbi:MAG: hypothetical protein K2O00_02045 [Muribaculaceae bacterium]|nr:hypothetical protein [Muribaculaceae bacterium]